MAYQIQTQEHSFFRVKFPTVIYICTEFVGWAYI